MNIIHPNKLTELQDITLKEYGVHEILAEVEWMADDTGYRFFHVKHADGSVPTISEAIEANNLNRISGGKQRMRGFALLAPQKITLEVWSDIQTYVDSHMLQINFLGAPDA